MAASAKCALCDHRAAYHQMSAPLRERRCVEDGCPCTDFEEILSTADYAEGARVEVRYPASIGAGQDRDEWPWLPGTILTRCDDIGHEFYVRVDVDELADEDDDGELWYPGCFRNPEELRPFLLRSVAPTR